MLPAKMQGRILQALAVTEGRRRAGNRRRQRLSLRLPRQARLARALVGDFPGSRRTGAANLLAAAINNVSVEAADAMQLNEQSAYDVIAVTGSLPIYDERFQQALRIGGRLFVVVGQAPIMEAWRVMRVGEREWQRQACSRPCSSRWSMRRAHRHSCSDPVTFALPAGSSSKPLIHLLP